MLLLPKHPVAADVFAWAEQWLAHLSREDFAAAYAMFLPDSRWSWTPKLIEELIANHGTLDPDLSGHRFRVTPPEDAIGDPCLGKFEIDPNDPDVTGDCHPRFPFSVMWCREPLRTSVGGVIVGELHIGYPLNGEWSALSSTFDMVFLGNGVALDLERIEVM